MSMEAGPPVLGYEFKAIYSGLKQYIAKYNPQGKGILEALIKQADVEPDAPVRCRLSSSQNAKSRKQLESRVKGVIKAWQSEWNRSGEKVIAYHVVVVDGHHCGELYWSGSTEPVKRTQWIIAACLRAHVPAPANSSSNPIANEIGYVTSYDFLSAHCHNAGSIGLKRFGRVGLVPDHELLYWIGDSPEAVADRLSRTIAFAEDAVASTNRQMRGGGELRLQIGIDIARETVRTSGSSNLPPYLSPEGVLSRALALSALKETRSPTDSAPYHSWRPFQESAVAVGRAAMLLLKGQSFFEPHNDESGSTAYRLWAHFPRPEDAMRSTIKLLPHSVREPRYSPRYFQARDAEHASRIARALVSATLAQRPDAFALHWECHSTRRDDLISTVVESLRDLFDVNQAAARRVLEERAKAWFSKKYHGAPDELVTSVLALVLGSDQSASYSRILEQLTALFSHLSSREPSLTIIVENFGAADELTRKLVEALAAQSDDNRPNLLIIEAPQSADGADILDPSREWNVVGEECLTPSLTIPAEIAANAMALECLQIAAQLGWDFPRSYLRKLWRALRAGDNEREQRPELNAEFEEVLSLLLRRGLLRYSGRLADIGETRFGYRELRFTSPAILKRVSDETPSELAERIANLSPVLVAEIIQSASDVPYIRRKLMVCRLLSRANPDAIRRLGLEKLLKLWMIVVDRADSAEARGEASGRLAKARAAIAVFDDREQATMPREVLEIYAKLVRYDSDHAQSRDAQLLIEAYDRFEESLGQPLISQDQLIGWFALLRALWNRKQHWGSLEEALDILEFIDDPRRKKLSQMLQLEFEHLKAVTNFGCGDLLACASASLSGRLLCEQMGGAHPAKPWLPQHGHHDGAVCCKMLFVIVMTLKCRMQLNLGEAPHCSESELQNASDKAIGYALEGNDTPTIIIARAFEALRLFLLKQHDRALRQIEKALQRDVKNQQHAARTWRNFVTLLRKCIEIAKLAEAVEADVPEWADARRQTAKALVTELKELAEHWDQYSYEYKGVWLTYQGLGLALAGNDAEALKCFSAAEALTDANERGECFFLADIYRQRAAAHKMAGRLDEAKADESAMWRHDAKILETVRNVSLSTTADQLATLMNGTTRRQRTRRGS
jgi:hypothetical protein